MNIMEKNIMRILPLKHGADKNIYGIAHSVDGILLSE